MPVQTSSPQKSSRYWLFPIIISTATIIGGVFGNIIAPKVEKWFHVEHYWLIWVIFALASVATIVMAIIASRRENATSASSSGVNLSLSGNLSIGGDVVGRDKTEDKSIHVGDLHQTRAVAIWHNVTVIQQSTISLVNALHQLPTPPADFTGRDAELNELMAKLETGGVTISGLQGMAASAKPRWR